MPKSQQSWVRSQHPSTHWTGAANEAVLNKVQIKNPKNPPARNIWTMSRDRTLDQPQFTDGLWHSISLKIEFSDQPTLLARGCVSGLLYWLAVRISPSHPPWVTRRGEKWREGDSNHLQHGHVTSPPSYLGWGDGQQQQQQFFHTLPCIQTAHSILFNSIHIIYWR